ncbi:MAG: hypothetical protein ACI85F_001936, partial [Bacteroidia bacterium]
TFLARMAPKINPNPQLNSATITVRNVTIPAALAVLLQYFVAFPMNLSTGFVSANVCPKTNINIICIANTIKGGFQSPFSQNCRISIPRSTPVVSDVVSPNAKSIVTKVSTTAIVKGAGSSVLKAFSMADERFNLKSLVFRVASYE